jgi:hypothetical protein
MLCIEILYATTFQLQIHILVQQKKKQFIAETRELRGFFG